MGIIICANARDGQATPTVSATTIANAIVSAGRRSVQRELVVAAEAIAVPPINAQRSIVCYSGALHAGLTSKNACARHLIPRRFRPADAVIRQRSGRSHLPYSIATRRPE